MPLQKLIVSRVNTALDACIERVEDALTLLPSPLRRWLDKGRDNALSVGAGDLFVANWFAGTDDPVEARRMLRLQADRICPIEPSQTRSAFVLKGRGQWRVAFIRHEILETMSGAADAAVFTDGEDVFCFRSTDQIARHRRGVAMLVGLLVAGFLGFLVLAWSYDARMGRALSDAQTMRAQEQESLRSLVLPAAGDVSVLSAAQSVRRLDQVAALRPEGWDLLVLEWDASSTTVQFEFDQALQGQLAEFRSGLVGTAGVLSVQDRTLGIRNGRVRLQVDIQYAEAEE